MGLSVDGRVSDVEFRVNNGARGRPNPRSIHYGQHASGAESSRPVRLSWLGVRLGRLGMRPQRLAPARRCGRVRSGPRVVDLLPGVPIARRGARCRHAVEYPQEGVADRFPGEFRPSVRVRRSTFRAERLLRDCGAALADSDEFLRGWRISLARQQIAFPRTKFPRGTTASGNSFAQRRNPGVSRSQGGLFAAPERW